MSVRATNSPGTNTKSSTCTGPSHCTSVKVYKLISTQHWQLSSLCTKAIMITKCSSIINQVFICFSVLGHLVCRDSEVVWCLSRWYWKWLISGGNPNPCEFVPLDNSTKDHGDSGVLLSANVHPWECCKFDFKTDVMLTSSDLHSGLPPRKPSSPMLGRHLGHVNPTLQGFKFAILWSWHIVWHHLLI